ncbi:MAG: pyridoxamine 5'-phosphate oxidase family protein [Actinomycetota bacterium]|nr:pyridoxamine 5'-phosphate oxidase family protein [Actinomycetota bacterium]
MSSWQEFATQVPDFAQRVEGLFVAYKHHTMATLRLDGSPRISGTEVTFDDGRLLLGMMPGTRRAADLRRDPRLAIHSHTVDPLETNPASWDGDAKITGRAVELPAGLRPPEGSDWFAVEVAEVVLTKVGDPADHLVIESWKADRGHKTQRR